MNNKNNIVKFGPNPFLYISQNKDNNTTKEKENYPEYNMNNIKEVEIFANDLAKLIDEMETDTKR